jgi:hypothetical protein
LYSSKRTLGISASRKKEMAKSDQNGHGHIAEKPALSSHRPAVELSHKVSDVHVKGVVFFIVGLTVMTVSVYLLMLLMFKVMDRQEVSKERTPSPMALNEKERLPPEPRLQSAPGFGVDSNGTRVDLSLKAPQEEYRAVHKQWEDVLHQGPKDQSGRALGLPIDQAMKRVLEGKGLPSRSPQDKPPGASEFWDYATQMPTAASAGRMTEQRRQ